MDKILNHILRPEDQIIKYGLVDSKVLLELKLTTALYKNIEIVWDFYDDEKRPYRKNWTDVEGMGYGWLWLLEEDDESKWRELLAKKVLKETDELKREMNDTLYFVYENEKVKTFHFIYLGEYRAYRRDTIFSFSNEDMYY